MASREEKELQDVERCMEEELVAEHMQVERVIHLRLEHVEGQQQLKYLVKVRGSFHLRLELMKGQKQLKYASRCASCACALITEPL